MIATSYVSKHPVLGFLTNLTDRFIIGKIKAPGKEGDAAQEHTDTDDEASTSKRRKVNAPKKGYSIEIFDTAQVSEGDCKECRCCKCGAGLKCGKCKRMPDCYCKAFRSPLDFACLSIAYWLLQCSTDPYFGLISANERRQRKDPYNLHYLEPYFNTQQRLRDLFRESSTNDNVLEEFRSQLDVCETTFEKYQFILNRLTSEFQADLFPNSRENDPIYDAPPFMMFS